MGRKGDHMAIKIANLSLLELSSFSLNWNVPFFTYSRNNILLRNRVICLFPGYKRIENELDLPTEGIAL